jgi:NAD(P)-dependent dehydrogenase (short-subunit alcohol dehydrogenase family)
MGRLLETTPEVFEQTWRLHTFGAFLWARRVPAAMLARGGGSILFTGATAGVRLWPNSAAFAPAKFALCGLAQVMARDFHPQGVHVGYVNVDGSIDMPLLRKFRPEGKERISSNRRRSPTHSGISLTRIRVPGLANSMSGPSKRSSSPQRSGPRHGA